ncbi:site-2 protease family protein [Hoeflea sp. WL0058]|uniref:Zinc metalloprotease n=1 Tax=Flavimaribacter sediminis TaxID=2865987 RepID=A0AAE3D001_9HYPH|nr:site-2 protease family protein [Flavimaribacter sediminis]MBW8636261.1 site-2 protease family protein [Flavimaribacter sediminis]
MFRNAVNLFEVLGFKVRVDPSWLLIAALIVWSLSAAYFPDALPGYSRSAYVVLSVIAMLGLFASLILHELSHSVVARSFGLSVGGITLFVFGGVAELEQEPASPQSEFWIAIAGPIMSFALAGLFFLLSLLVSGGETTSWLHALFAYLALINLILAVFNLAPAFPLDGGRVLRAVLWHYRKDLFSATRIASAFGTGFGVFLIATGVLAVFSASSAAGLWQILIGFFILSASRGSYRQLVVKAALKDKTVRSLMSSPPIAAQIDDTIKHTVQETMMPKKVSFVPVLEGDKLAGYVDTALVHGVDREKWATTRLISIVAPVSDENTVSPDAAMEDLFQRMTQTGRRKMLVVEDNRLVGVISLSDLMSWLAIRQELGGLESGVSPRRS